MQKNNLHLPTKPTYGGSGYLEKQDFIIENQKEKISVQKKILAETDTVLSSTLGAPDLSYIRQIK